MDNETVTTSSRVAKATGVLAAMTAISRILGMCRDVALAHAFGAGLISDAFFVAFRIPNLLRRIVAEGSLAVAFVPVFVEENHRSPEEGQRVFSGALSLILLLTFPCVVFGSIYSEQIIQLISPGFGVGSEKSELASNLLIVMLPYTVVIGVIALCSAALNGVHSFFAPSLPQVIFNSVMIAAVLLCSSWFAQPIFAAGWSVLVGAGLGLVPLIFALRRRGLRLRLASPWGSPALKRLITLFIPALLSASLYQVIVFLNSLLASLLEEGSISWLYYADRLFQFPLGVFSLALATAALPRLSQLAAQGDDESLGRELSQFISWITFLTVPAACALIGLSKPLTALMYQRGTFTGEATLQTAAALSAYAVGLWTISCHTVIARAFIAKGNTIIPSAVAIIAIVLNVILALAFMGPPAGKLSTPLAEQLFYLQQSLELYSLGHAGIALAGSLASFFSFYSLALLLPRIGVHCYTDEIMPPIIKSFVASLIMLGVLKAILLIKLNVFLTVMIAVPLGIMTFFVAALALRLDLASQTLGFIRERIQRFTRRTA